MRLSQICIAIAQLGRGGAWSPLSLWPDGISSAGMWISPRTLDSQWQDYTGTTPVVTPGTVADTSNPVGLALDIRAGAPGTLGPELVVNGDFSDGSTGWVLTVAFTVSDGKLVGDDSAGNRAHQDNVTTAGKWYQVSFDYASISGVQLRLCNTANVALVVFAVATGTSGTHSAKFLATGTTLHIEANLAAFVGTLDNISVKEVPGNHMLQSTSAARPLMSARVNLLTYTEDFSNAVWYEQVYGAASLTKTPNYTTAPDGTSTACRVLISSVDDAAWLQNAAYTTPDSVPITRTVWMKSNTASSYVVTLRPGSPIAKVTVTPAWTEFDLTLTTSAVTGFNVGLRLADGTATACDISIWHPQTEIGTTATPYQSVPGDGSTYATDFPIYQKYDGTDDGMATAAFTAGTLVNGMDCMIPVRRDSAAACVAGIYNGIADATKFFGMAESGSGSGCVGSAAGTPTVWVDGVQLSGGTAVTRGTLHTALTVGDWHILEFRGLDLSTWTAAGFGLYTSYVFPGARGDIMLYPSTDSTADKDAARQWLADYYGVTLP